MNKEKTTAQPFKASPFGGGLEGAIINKSISSQSVQRMATAKRMRDREVWSLFFDSGVDYLDQLRNRITHYSVFKAQFGDITTNATPTEAFRLIQASPHFWDWWSTQLWRVCNTFPGNSEVELRTRLMFNTSLIPQSTLKKIFTDGNHKEYSGKQTRMPVGFKHRTEQVC